MRQTPSRTVFLNVKTTIHHLFSLSDLQVFALWRSQNPLRKTEDPITGKSFIQFRERIETW